jgi:hypothetical protein
VLTAAGFADVEITEVREPVCHGPDAAGARAALFELRMVQDWSPTWTRRGRLALSTGC